MKHFKGLENLLCESESAHDFYTSLPYDIQVKLITDKDEIHTMKDIVSHTHKAKKHSNSTYM